jgi:hypothetical protein
MKRVVLGGVAMAMAITANAAELTAKENTIVDIGAAVARGEQDKLGTALEKRGLASRGLMPHDGEALDFQLKAGSH